MELILRGYEIWRDIEGWEGLYQISNCGNVKSLHFNKERIMKQVSDTKGYKQVRFCNKSKTEMPLIHRLVAQAFIPNPDNKPEVNHHDNDKTNNHDWNLEWVTRAENIQYAVKTGTHFIARGSKNGTAIIDESTAKLIKQELIKEKKPGKIAEILNVNVDIVKDIKRGRTWNHVEVN